MFFSYLEQTLQTDCDELMGKLHGLEDSYSAISDKWAFLLSDKYRYMTVSSSSVGVGQTLKSLFGQVFSTKARMTRRKSERRRHSTF